MNEHEKGRSNNGQSNASIELSEPYREGPSLVTSLTKLELDINVSSLASKRHCGCGHEKLNSSIPFPSRIEHSYSNNMPTESYTRSHQNNTGSETSSIPNALDIGIRSDGVEMPVFEEMTGGLKQTPLKCPPKKPRMVGESADHKKGTENSFTRQTLMPSGDQSLQRLRPSSLDIGNPSKISEGVDSLSLEGAWSAPYKMLQELSPERYKDQESQVSDTLTPANADGAFDNGTGHKDVCLNTPTSMSVNATALSASRNLPYTGEYSQLIGAKVPRTPPPSYYECFGHAVGFDQSLRFQPVVAPKLQGRTSITHPNNPGGPGTEGGDAVTWHKPRTQNNMETTGDSQCEVLIFRDQNETRQQDTEDATADHQLLAFLSCVLFWPIGLLALYYANMAHTMKSEGLLQQSFYYSKRALALSLTAITVGTFMYLFFYMRNRIHV